MEKQLYSSAASLVLLLHLIWIVFVIAGALFTRERPRLTALHIASLLWGIVAEAGPCPCPLTWLENAFEAHAGIAPFSGGFIIHYLDRTVYPNLSPQLLTSCGIAVCAVNLAVYGFRGWRWRESRGK
jgi:hypothetical protein